MNESVAEIADVAAKHRRWVACFDALNSCVARKVVTPEWYAAFDAHLDRLIVARDDYFLAVDGEAFAGNPLVVFPSMRFERPGVV